MTLERLCSGCVWKLTKSNDHVDNNDIFGFQFVCWLGALLSKFRQENQTIFEAIKILVYCLFDVFVFYKDQKQVTGKPGSFGEICKTLKENGINIIFGYPAENNRFIFGVDYIEKAKLLLE